MIAFISVLLYLNPLMWMPNVDNEYQEICEEQLADIKFYGRQAADTNNLSQAARLRLFIV